jgi:hypothetical protein
MNNNMTKTIIIIVIALAVIAGGGYLIYRPASPNLPLRPRSEASQRGEQAIAPLASAPAAGTDTAGLAQSVAPEKSGEPAAEMIPAPIIAPKAVAEIAGYQYTEAYTSSTYGFSFKYPKEFAVSEIPGEASDVILVQNTAKNIGAQIVISPFDGEDIDITADFIKAELPNLKIGEPQEANIGSGRKGLAFVSDNAAFGGKSREVWFVFNGNLYQLSAYAELDGFLRGLFGTWEFTSRE